MASTISDREVPVSNTNALAFSSSIPICVSCAVVAAVPATVELAFCIAPWASLTTAVSSCMLTVSFPCVTAVGVTLTSPPITIVPVLALTTTLALGLAGSTSIFSSKLTKDTFCAGSSGDLTFIEVASKGTATSGPKISFIFSETILAVLKSP